MHNWEGLTIGRGRYEVRATLAEGGMARVYQAWDKHLYTHVVVKVPSLRDADAVQRFLHETRSLVSLAHPHIVRILDVDYQGGVPFAVLQYLAGGDLGQRRPRDRAGRPLPAPESDLHTWLHPIAKALDFIHRRGYVHRDVKPGNILFDEHDHAYLGDFGVIKSTAQATPAVDTKLTAMGMVLGTAEYMAPEVIMGKKFDGRADQYALALIVYEMLAGRHPLEAPSPHAQFVLHATAEPPRLESFVPDISASVATAVHQALSKRPEERFTSCLAFARAILLRDATPRQQPAIQVPAHRSPPLPQPAPAPSPHLLSKSATNDPFGGAGRPPPVPAAPFSQPSPNTFATAQGITPPPRPAVMEDRQSGSVPTSDPPTQENLHEQVAQGATGPRHPLAPTEQPPKRTGARPHAPVRAALLGMVISWMQKLQSFRSLPPFAREMLHRKRERLARWAQAQPSSPQQNGAAPQHTPAVTAPLAEQTAAPPGESTVIVATPVSRRDGVLRRVYTFWNGLGMTTKTALIVSLISVVLALMTFCLMLLRVPPAAEPYIKPGHTVPIHSLSFASDGSRLALGYSDGAATLWQCKTGRFTGSLRDHTEAVVSVEFGPDGQRLVTGSEDSTTKLWDLSKGEVLWSVRPCAFYRIKATISPDGWFVATADRDAVRLWHVDTGDPLGVPLRLDFAALCFSPDAQLLAGGGWGTVTLCHTNPLGVVRTWHAHDRRIDAIAFSPDGNLIGTGSADNTAKLWRTATGELVRTLQGHAGAVVAVAFSPDGRLIATCSDDTTVAIWEVSTGQRLHWWQAHRTAVTALGFRPDGRLLATASSGGSCTFWDVSTGRSVCSILYFSHGGWLAVTSGGYFDYDGSEETLSLLRHVDLAKRTLLPVERSKVYYRPDLVRKALK